MPPEAASSVAPLSQRPSPVCRQSFSYSSRHRLNKFSILYKKICNCQYQGREDMVDTVGVVI